MKRIIGFILAITSVLVLFTSCQGDDGAPVGMKLAKGGEEVGYKMFVPEEWTVSNIGDIAMAHVSSIDSTSVSFVQIDAPEGGFKSSEVAISYFENDIESLPYTIARSETEWGKECTFGNVDIAYKFVYDFEYSEVSYRAMQILVSYSGRSYVFTYQASPEMISEDTSYYSYYYERVAHIIEAFVFIDKVDSEVSLPEDPDGDGYYLASDKKISGFELYLPLSYKCEYSEGIVSAKVADGANISLTKATGTGVSVKDYYAQRKAAIESFAVEFTEIEGEINKTEGVVLGNLTTAASYEYTYVYNGVKYHVYQIMGVDTFDGYVFTYTATENCYAEHLDSVKDVLAKVVF